MPSKKRTNKPKEGNLSILINYAVNQGFEELAESHPIFKDYKRMIHNHIDEKKLNEKARELLKYKKIDPKNISEEDSKYISKQLSEYVASGAALDETGQEIILGKGLEDKVSSGFFGKIRSLFKEDSSEGIQYLNKSIQAVNDLKEIFEGGDYQKQMPEITEAISTLDNLGTLYSAARVLRAHDWINESQYNQIASKVYKIAKDAPTKIREGIEKRMDDNYQKIAASIFGIIGLFVIIANLRITGGVIGSHIASSNFIGIILIAISLALFLLKSKGKIKRNFKK